MSYIYLKKAFIHEWKRYYFRKKLQRVFWHELNIWERIKFVIWGEI